AVAAPSPATEAALVARLRPAGRPATAGSRVDILDLSMHETASVGDLPALAPDPAAAVLGLVDDVHGAAAGPSAVIDAFPCQTSAARIDKDEVVIGYLVQRRRLATSEQQVGLLTKLVATDARLLLGNASGDLWTDLRKPVTGPPPAILHSANFIRYQR